jgi:hypothetical protein
VVAVQMGGDHVPHGVPAEADPFERRGDVAFTPRRPGIHDGRLAAAREDVRGHEPKVDALPGRATAACGG